MRYLAIDLGGKRTGVAVGDDVMRIASPLDVLEATTDAHRLQLLRAVVHKQDPDALVLGCPFNMDGSEGPSARKARAFAALLVECFDLPVHLQDERLTSAVADEQMARTGLTHGQKKAKRDALAAAAILRAFWETLD